MDNFITSRKKITALIKHAGIRPKREFGQNYLVNASVAERLVKSGGINKDDIVVEPGAGIGALSFHIAASAQKVLCVEIDKKAVETLKELTKGLGYKNIEVVHQDILSFSPDDHGLKDYKVVGSLPYDLAKKIIRKFIEEENIKPAIMSVLIQKEVAKEYVAKPPSTTFLAQYAQIHSEVDFIQNVTKQAFYPVPPVDGGILQFKLRNKPIVTDDEKYRGFLKTAFSSKRTTLLNTLSNQLKIEKKKLGKIFEKKNIALSARPQELDTKSWIALFNAIG